MGFEQLAELKKQLAEQVEKTKPQRTVKAKKPKHEPVDKVVFIIGRLQKLFPLAFPKSPSPKVPLKVGILEDLQARSEEISISKDDLQLAVKTWCKSPRYWSVTKEGAVRIDLEGHPAGIVEANGAAQARMMASKHFKAKQTTSEMATHKTDL
jgi:ProP effector